MYIIFGASYFIYWYSNPTDAPTYQPVNYYFRWMIPTNNNGNFTYRTIIDNGALIP